MSTKNINSAVGNWNNSIPFPKDAYVLHCLEEEMKIAGSGSPMLHRTWEIVSPEVITVGDRTYNIAGQTIEQYVVSKVSDGQGGWDEKKSDGCFSRLCEDLKTLGYDQDTVDDENPPKIAKGKTVNAIVVAEEGTARKSPTAEQLAKGIKVGEPIKVNGKEVKTYQLKITQIVSLSDNVKIESAF